MLRRNKYNELQRLVRKVDKLAFLLGIKVRSLKKEYAKGKISKEQYDEMCNEITNKAYPNIKVVGHYIYENSMDLKRYSKEIEEYVAKQDEGNSFLANYRKNLNDAIKVILFCAIFEKENIDYPKQNNIEILLNMVGYGSYDINLDDTIKKMSESGASLFKKIIGSEFDYELLTEEENDLLEEYHNEYMNKNIYPAVKNLDEGRKGQVLSAAKKIGR